MADVYLDSLQLNTGNIRVNIVRSDSSPNFNKASHEIPGKSRPVQYFTSGGDELYKLEVTLYRRAGSFQELTNKVRQVHDLLRQKVESGEPLLIKTVPSGSEYCPVYLNSESVYVYITSPDFPMRGSDGKNMITFNLNGEVLGVPASEGGDVVLGTYYSVVSL